MLLKFCFDFEAIKDTDNQFARTLVEALKQAWGPHGILSSSYPPYDEIADIIRSLTNEGAKDKWRSTLKILRSNQHDYLVDVNDCEDFEVKLLSIAHAKQRGITDKSEKRSIIYDNFEFISMTEVILSQKFAYRRNELAQTTIPASDPLVNLWEQRLEPLASRSTDVFIVDRYAFQNINQDGLYGLLVSLDRCASVESVTIYSSAGNYVKERQMSGRNRRRLQAAVQRAKTIRQELAQMMPFENIKRIEVYNPGYFAEAHGRHIRFGSNRACTIDIGLEEGMRAERIADFSYKYGDRQIEGLLQKEAVLIKNTLTENPNLYFSLPE